MQQPNKADLETFIKAGLLEDIQDGDHTSLACIPKDAKGKARLLVKDEGILAGVDLAIAMFKYVEPDCVIHQHLKDGDVIKYGDIAFEVEATVHTILKTERLALNAMQRMSGVATLTRKFVEVVEGTGVKLLDTRKTTPLLRFLEKWAVRIGGGTNYREGLYDRIMIKDNHIDFCGGVKKAILQVQDYLKNNDLDLETTVEVRDLEELSAVLEVGGIERIMFDNFDTKTMKKAVDLVGNRFETEASGGITLETVRGYAETGVQFISVGALTHSFKSLDLSLKKS